MITNLSNENADLPDIMNSNRKFDVSLDGTLLSQTKNLMPLFRALKGKTHQLPVVTSDVRYVNILVA